MATYTYSIFDADPDVSGPCSLLDHEDIELDADDDDDAVSDVRLELEVAAAGLSAEDGYGVGDRIYALVWSETGEVVGKPSYELTAEDLGIDSTGEPGEPGDEGQP